RHVLTPDPVPIVLRTSAHEARRTTTSRSMLATVDESSRAFNRFLRDPPARVLFVQLLGLGVVPRLRVRRAARDLGHQRRQVLLDTVEHDLLAVGLPDPDRERLLASPGRDARDVEPR